MTHFDISLTVNAIEIIMIGLNDSKLSHPPLDFTMLFFSSHLVTE